MEQQSPVLAILANESERLLGDQLAHLLGYNNAHIVIGSPIDASYYIEQNRISPSYIFLTIGSRKEDVLPELGELAQHCVAGTQLVVAGETNDIHFYRALLDHGAVDYFTLPVSMDQVAMALGRHGKPQATNQSTVVSLVSGAAGDGSSTIALNLAYCLAKEHGSKTIIVDMDYQYGMMAKNLDLSSPYGIRELFDHPDRGIDATLLDRMVIGYNNMLDIIAAPNDLKFMPPVQPELIRDLLVALREKYQFVILDLPHVWSPWVASALNHSDAIVLTAQLWLKSVTHASRLLNVLREMGMGLSHVRVAINRSGAKYKEGITPKDFERVCNLPISYYLSNDIKTVVQSENLGKTIIELGKSKLASEIQGLAAEIRSFKQTGSAAHQGVARLAFQNPSTRAG